MKVICPECGRIFETSAKTGTTCTCGKKFKITARVIAREVTLPSTTKKVVETTDTLPRRSRSRSSMALDWFILVRDLLEFTKDNGSKECAKIRGILNGTGHNARFQYAILKDFVLVFNKMLEERLK